eukprot:30100-Chlamydomonas_euryale.AAC.1
MGVGAGRAGEEGWKGWGCGQVAGFTLNQHRLGNFHQLHGRVGSWDKARRIGRGGVECVRGLWSKQGQAAGRSGRWEVTVGNGHPFGEGVRQRGLSGKEGWVERAELAPYRPS